MINEGKLQEALAEYVKCYREVQPLRPGSSECQQLMRAIQYLSRKYPAALGALAELRDAAMLQWRAEPERRELTFEIALLNERLGEGHRTLALYDALPPGDRGRQSLAMIANSSFVAARRYADALLGKPFGRMMGAIESGTQAYSKQKPEIQPSMRKSLVNDTLTNIEVLTGAGQREEARLLTEKLLAFDNTETTQMRLKEHVARAQGTQP